jgi:murein DD-endopeptidase MepM/ murein hydrolase activator NlpD
MRPSPGERSILTPRRALTAAVLVTAALASAGAGAALASGTAGGSAPPSTGGTTYVGTPKINAVSCVAACMSRGRVRSGGRLKIRGVRLAGVTKVVYEGARGRGDDVAVKTRSSSDRILKVPVPFGAHSGLLAAYAGRMHAQTRKPVRIMPAAAAQPNPHLSPAPGPAVPGAPRVETSTSRSLFAIDQRGGVRFSYRLSGPVPTSVEVTLLRLDTGGVVQSWSPDPGVAGEVHSVTWKGLSRGAPARSGRYAFRLVASTGAGAVRSARAGDVRRDAFDVEPALFPVLGRHDFGSAAARFGARRSGHTHQGQDVLAACGTPLRAARGGIVKAKHYHPAAGNYIVINGQNTSVDFAYMHLRSPSPYNVGDRVYTGDIVGVVGATGDATGCHLHFEEWSGPGWYSGGSPYDPLADLKAWDAYS